MAITGTGDFSGWGWVGDAASWVGDRLPRGMMGKSPPSWGGRSEPEPEPNPIPDWGSHQAGTGRVPGGFEVVEGGGLGPGSVPPPPPPPPPWERPEFDPSAITGPYGAFGDASGAAYGAFADASGAALGAYTSAADEAYETYKGLLEGIATGPRTSRIEEMYGLALAEANRRGESADAWEATQGERLESDFAAREERLGGLHEEFNTELDLIREASGERREGAKVEREARIDQVIADADLGEAAATFIVSSTATSDILDSQGTRQEAYDGRMDRLYAGVELDRVMALAGLESDARRDLADDVLAMKELVAEFRYNAGQAFQEQMFTAEENAYQREVDMTTALAELGYGHAGRMAELGYGHAGEMAEAGYTHAGEMADIGLQGALAVAGAEDAFDTQWDEVEAYLGNPVTGNAFAGMDPSLVGGAPPQQMFENWLDVLGTQDSGPSVGAPGAPVYWKDEQGSWWEIGTYGPAGQIVYDHTAISGISNPRDLSPQQLLQEIQRGILV